MMGYKVAVVGATGNVGREMLDILAERRFPPMRSWRSPRAARWAPRCPSATRRSSARRSSITTSPTTDICLMSAGGASPRNGRRRSPQQGCVVIDNSSCLALRFRRAADRARGERRRRRGLPQDGHHRQPELLDCAARRRAEAAARQGQDQARRGRDLSVGVRRRQGGDGRTVRADAPVFQLDEVASKKFTKRIAFNVIPHIDDVHGRRLHARKSGRWWRRRRRSSIRRSSSPRPACACRSSSAIAKRSTSSSRTPITPDEAREILRDAPGCLVIDKHEDGGYITPHEAAGEDATYISRIREDATVENGLAIWCVSDNLRKGAALNAIQIAEVLINRKLISAETEGGVILIPSFRVAAKRRAWVP